MISLRNIRHSSVPVLATLASLPGIYFTSSVALGEVLLGNENFTQYLNGTGHINGEYRLVEDIDLSQSVNGDQRNPGSIDKSIVYGCPRW